MSRWKIYSKDGSVLHESIEKYDGKGRVVEQDTLEYSGKWMGDCFITVSFKSAYPIDFQIGDYIIYRGEKFTINYDPTVVKKSSRGTYGEGFVYDSVKFNALSNELTDVKFHDWVLSDNQVHYSSLPNFSFYAKDMNDLADRLQACMDRWCKDNGFAKEDYWIFYTPGSAGDTNPYDRTITRAKDISTDETFLANVLTRWKSIYGDGGTLVERADELIDKNVQINNQTVWQGMALFKSDFGLNFIIRGREVIVGAAGTIASHIFKYGKGNGLYEVDRQADNDQKVVTRLHAYGSSDNLPTRYYAELDMKVFANVTSVDKGKDFFRLALDMDYKPSMFTQKMSKYGDDIFAIKIELEGTEIKARIEGHDDNNKAKIYSEYLANSTDPDDNTDKSVYDIFYNAVDTGKKIYITGGINKDLAPSGHIDYAANHLPDNMAINNLMLPGFPKYALSDLCKSEYDESSDTTNYYIRKDKDSTDYVKFHSESGNHVVRFSSEQYDPYIVSANADKLGYKDDDIFCTEENDDNGLKKVYPSVEEITEAEAGVSTDDKTYINTIVSADIIKDNGVYPKKTGTSVPGFQVVIKNLGFDLQDAIAAAGGESCKLSMKDGHCGGRDFDVPSVSKNSDGTWTLNCKRSPDSSLDLYYPYSYNMSIGGTASADEAYQIHKGDHFVLTGIAMEATNYVWAASVKLLRKAIHWLCKNDYSRYTYSPKIDEIYMARQDQEAQKSEGKVKSLHDTIKEGDLLWFQDDDLLLDGKVYIDQLVIKENGNNGIPTYDVTLRNEVQVGTIQRIQNKVDSIANDVKSGNVGGSMSASNVENIVNAVGDGKYLRKDKDDTTEHKLGVGGLDINGGDLNIKDGTSSFGITKEGVAKLACAVADYIKSSDFSKGTGMGFDGSGYGITKDAAGKYTLEIDNLVARMKMIVAQLEVHEMTFIGGTVVMSSCGNRMAIVEAMDGNGKVIDTANSDKPTLTIPDGKVADKFRCYFLASDGDFHIKNEWTVGQLALCKTNNIANPGDYSNYQNREYWRLVVAVSEAPVTIEGKSYHYIDLSNSTSKSISLTDKSGTTHVVTLGGVCESMASLPYAGDNVIGLGHCWDDKRQNAAILSMLEGGWVIYKGISAYDLPKANIVNKFGIDEAIITTDHLILRPYAAPSEMQTVAVVRGAYDDAASYGHNDMVTLDGQTWIGSGIEIGKTITGQKPSATSPYWSLAAAKGIQGEKGDGYTISFLLNDVPVDVINFDTVKGMEGTDVSLEADFFNNAVAVNVNKAVITCYDAEGNVLGSPIEKTEANNIVADGGNLYLSSTCQYITTAAYDADGKMLVSKSIGVVKNGVSVGVEKVSYKVINNVDANDSLNWDVHAEQAAYPTQKPDKGKYCYVMTIVTYTDGSTTNSVSTSYTAKDGDNGTSVTIKETKVEYAGGGNGTTAPTDGWGTNVPQLAQGQYLWTRTTITYSDGTPVVSYSVGRIGMDGAKGGTTHILYASSANPQSENDVRTTIDATHQYYGTYQDTEPNDDVKKYGSVTGWVLIKGDKGEAAPMYSLEVASGNNDVGNDSHIAYNGKTIVTSDSRGHTCYFLKGGTTPSVAYSKSYDTYGTPSLATDLATFLTGTDASAYANCILVIIGFDALTVNDDLRNALKSYGYGGDALLYNVGARRDSFVFVGQKGMSEGTAYYKMSKSSKVVLTASVSNGVLIGTGHKGDKGEQGATGSSLVTLITNYSYDQSGINAYSENGYSGTWAVQSTAGAKVGDTVLLRVTNTSKGGYCFIIAKITAIPSSTSVTCTSNGLIDKGEQGIQGPQGPQGNSFDAKFLLNGISIDVLNFDTIKSLEGSEVSLEVDFLNNGMAYNVNRATLTCYDAESNVLGSPIDVTEASSIIAEGGNLYLSKNCKLITAVAYNAAGNVLKEKSVTVIRNTITYRLIKMSDTSATVLASGTTTNATFRLHYNLHYKAVKMVGTVAHDATIASIKATIDGAEKVATVNGLEGTLSGDGTKPYDAEHRPVNSLPVTVTLADGTVLYDSVPVTMEAGVAIDINNNIGEMSATVKGHGTDISTLKSDGKSISAKVSEMDSDLKATGVDIENHKITATANNFVVRNNSGTTTFSIDKDGNIVGAGDAYFKGTITGSVISGSTIKSEDGTYKTTIQGGSITTNNIAATGGSIGEWTIKGGGLSAEYGSKACIDMRDSKSSFRLDSDKTTNGGSLLSIYNYSGRVMSIVSEDSDESALYIRSNGNGRNLAISTFGNNSFLSRVREGTVINRLAYACVRTGDVNVDFDDLFVTKETGESKYPGNVVITSNYNYEQTVKFPANPVLGVQLIVIQGTNTKVHFDGNGHSFQQGTDVSSSANSNQNGQWNLFIFDGQYWQCIYITGHLLW